MGFFQRWAGVLGAATALLLLAIAALLIFQGEDLEARDKLGRTPLILAAEEGEEQRVRDLLSRGARIEAEDNCEWTALMRAASHGHLETVQFLIDQGAAVNKQGRLGFTALMAAAMNGHHDTAELLIAQGADLSPREEETGKSALELAIMNDDQRMIELLVEAREE